MDKQLSRNKQIIINIIGSIFAVLANVIISFFVSPYIVKVLGVEANGFISLANNFVSYASLITIALNSMAGRYITIKLQQDDVEDANKYYTSVFIGNLGIVSMLLIPAIFLVINLEKLINISDYLILDVKILFSLIFLNFFLSTGTPNWDTATYVRNKLYLRSLISIGSGFIRVGVIVILFWLLKPSVYFMGIANISMTLFCLLCSCYYKIKLLPELNIRKKYFDLGTIKELVSSGIWNTISSSGNMLLEGFDLLIANVFIGSTGMGILALAKMVPTLLTQIIGTVAATFGPLVTVDYAKGDFELFEYDVKKSMKILEIIITIPLGIIIVFGSEFFSLWVPSQNAHVLQIVSLLTCFGLIFTSGMQCLCNIFTATNRLKYNSLLTVVSGLVSTGLVVILLKTTNLGIYAIAGVSSFVVLIKDLFLIIPYSAKCLNLKWHTFYPGVLISAIGVLISVISGFCMKQIIAIDSWLMFFIAVISTGMIGLLLDLYTILNKNERKNLFNYILKRANLRINL